MGPRTIIGRVVAAVCVAVHLVVAGVLPAADARLEAATYADTELHVEAEAAVPCGFRHDHVRCQLCRALDRPFQAPIRLVAVGPEHELTMRSRPMHDAPVSPGPKLARNARSPPPHLF